MTGEAARAATAAAPAPAPSLGRAVRDGLGDLYFNSWRVVPVNLVLGLGMVGVALAWTAWGALVAAVVAAPLALPLAGLFRLGAMATRRRDVNLSDALDPVREAPVRTLAAGLAFSIALLVLGTNLVIGLVSGGLLPWIVAVCAGWGLVGLVAYGFAWWPLAVDPERAGVRWSAKARLAALLLLAYPVRLLALTAVLAAVLAVGTALVAVLLTVAPGLCAMVACRYVLPAADRLEARLGAASPR